MPIYRQKIPTFPNPASRVYFVHIPRTAGRFIEANIEANGFKIEPAYFDNTETPTIEGVQYLHLHRELYDKYLSISDIPHIAIVRNPIDRFMSLSFFLTHMYGDDIQETMEDEMTFLSMLENFPFKQISNHFRPQMDFISSKTNLWKMEDGFGNDFDEWVSDILGVEYKTRDVPAEKLDLDETRKLEKSDRLIDNIKSLYSQDIEHLYPELATPFEEGT